MPRVAPQEKSALMSDRRAVSEVAGLRGPSNDLEPAQRRSCGERKAHPATGAFYGAHANPAETRHRSADERAQDLPIPAERDACGSSEPGLVCRHRPSANAQGLSISGGDHGWHARTVLSWRMSDAIEADFCVASLDEAICRVEPPDIMNSDQGSRFTSSARTDRLRRSGIRISSPLHIHMDCRGSGWTARAATRTPSSSSASGARRDTGASIRMPARPGSQARRGVDRRIDFPDRRPPQKGPWRQTARGAPPRETKSCNPVSRSKEKPEKRCIPSIVSGVAQPAPETACNRVPPCGVAHGRPDGCRRAELVNRPARQAG